MLVSVFLALVATAAGQPTHSFIKRATSSNGIATFNNYAAQSSTNCGPKSGQPGTYGAAASDISPDISGGACPGSINLSNCNGQVPIIAAAPECPRGNCGRCYKVTNAGGIGGSIGGMGNSVIVQIIDSCPAVSPMNYCKTDMPLNQTCGDTGTNQLDIDQSAYMPLTGQAFGSGPTLKITIEDSDCTGNTVAGAAAATATPTSPAAVLGQLENEGASNAGNGRQRKTAAGVGSGANRGTSPQKAALQVEPGNQAGGSLSSTQSAAAQTSSIQNLPPPPAPSSEAQTSSTLIPLAANSTASAPVASVSSSSAPNPASSGQNLSGVYADGECDG